MQEDHLVQESTTDDESGSMISGGSSSLGSAPRVNAAQFRIEKHEDMMSSESSNDPKMLELVQYVRRQSVDMAKEIDSVLTSTDDSDEDSLKRTRSSGKSNVEDPMDPVKERLRLLLIDRKAQKDLIDAQKSEIQALRAAAKEAGAKTNGSLEVVALQGEIGELRRENEVFKARLVEARAEQEQKDILVAQEQARVAKLLQQNDAQSKMIDSLNEKISRQLSAASTAAAAAVESEARGGTIRKTTGGLSTTQNNTFDEDFQALDAALGEIDSTRSVTASKPAARSADDAAAAAAAAAAANRKVASLEAEVQAKNEELNSLRSAVKRLEALALADSSSEPGSARSGAASSSQLKFLKETNDEQAQTIKLQKSTIGSLKEEVELLTRQISEHASNNQVNAEKQKQIQAAQRADQARLQEQADKLARDKQEFTKHLKEFKELRKELFEGNVTLSNAAGVPKSRYRQLRHKRDKYKRKDYRKGHEMNAMQKRLLQNVELLEVEDSQSSSTTDNANASTNAASDRDESKSQGGSHKSVQLVHDSSSEHADSE